ncbi:hypothetical protein MTO96_039113 [Rhipicephalus appendiculatus]
MKSCRQPRRRRERNFSKNCSGCVRSIRVSCCPSTLRAPSKCKARNILAPCQARMQPYGDKQVGGVLAVPRDVAVEKPSNADDSDKDHVHSEAVMLKDNPGEAAESTGVKTPKPALPVLHQRLKKRLSMVKRLGGLPSPFQKRLCGVRDGYPILKESHQFIAFNIEDLKKWISGIQKNSQMFSSIPTGDFCEENPAYVHQPATQPPASKLLLPSPRQVLPRVPAAPILPEAERKLEYECVEGQTTITAAPLHEDGETYLSDDTETSSQTDEEVTSDYESWYQAIWDCHAEQPDELSFKRGDLLKVVSKDLYDEHSWWVAKSRGSNGSVGFVPKTYLMAAYIRVQ